MHFVGKSSRHATVGILMIAFALVPGIAAAKGPGESEGEPSGEKNGKEISASVSLIDYDESKNGKGRTNGPVTSAGNWTPPACWYEPKYTPKQYKEFWEPIWATPSVGHEWSSKLRDRYEGGNPYKDFNLEKQGEGNWWTGVSNQNRLNDPDAQSCDEFTYFWVPDGEKPNNPKAVTPEILAQLAYDRILVPETKVDLAPQDTTKVNLPTWAWLDEAEFKPVSVTASLPTLGIEATTTATPVSLKMEPGTKDAQLHPASGECPIVDGSIGTPYTKGNSNKTPPCGLTYLRASTDVPFKLQATITWEIHWTGTGIDGEQPLPNGTFGTDQDVVVQEVQAINR
ncbi:hypothetical protein [Streptomyces sp. NPDC001820]|uniref:hypothetical protein n=1 Tax=Streptomyces sp. NPDC001820 TaxID=3364613 RepID=UPI0036A94A82